jgi:hypothetical protein
MDTRNNKAEIESVCLTLRAYDVRTIAHMYREAGNEELDEDRPFLRRKALSRPRGYIGRSAMFTSQRRWKPKRKASAKKPE